MSETFKILLLVCVLILVYTLTRKVHTWRIKRAYFSIIKDVEQRGALNPSTAVELPWAKRTMFRFGTRDYRPKALEYLIAYNIIGITDDGRHYLKTKEVGFLGSK